METNETEAEAPATEAVAETPVEEAPVAAEAAPTEAVAETQEEEFNAAEVLLAGEKPEWMRAHDHALDEEEKKGFSISDDQMEELSPVAKQLITNFRRMADSAASKHSEETKSLRLQRIELEKQSLELKAQGLAGLTVYKDERLREFAKAPEGRQPDPHTPEGAAWLAQKAGSDFFSKFFNNVDDVLKERTEAKEKQEAEAAYDTECNTMADFIEQKTEEGKWNPEVFTGVKANLEAFGEKMDIETAYKLYMIDHGDAAPAAPSPQSMSEARAAARQTSRRPGNKLPSSVQIPNNESSREDMDDLLAMSDIDIGSILKQLQAGRGSSM